MDVIKKIKNFKIPLIYAWSLIGGLSLVMFSWVSPVFADAAAKVPAFSAGNTAWVLASSALVLLMTPGLGFFLRRHGKEKKRLKYDISEFYCYCHRQRYMDFMGLFFGLRT